MGAPHLLDVPEGEVDPVKIAMREYRNGVIPITVRANKTPRIKITTV